MGLDTVEFVMDLEKEFSIEISDSEAESLGIIRDIADFVEVKNRAMNIELSHDVILNKITEILVNNYGIPESEIHPRAHVVYDLKLD